jgi:hypothetical protein
MSHLGIIKNVALKILLLFYKSEIVDIYEIIDSKCLDKIN